MRTREVAGDRSGRDATFAPGGLPDPLLRVRSGVSLRFLPIRRAVSAVVRMPSRRLRRYLVVQLTEQVRLDLDAEFDALQSNVPFLVGYWRTHLPLLNWTIRKHEVVLPSLKDRLPIMPPASKSVSALDRGDEVRAGEPVHAVGLDDRVHRVGERQHRCVRVRRELVRRATDLLHVGDEVRRRSC